ncbi:OLC1v1016827C1 [Oldenlandia corymbosa var. corymbosa]|uniref:non-specific serine/threonine protein kinase n=1 Tax=Oldenlandia corymbosa var. corymbosa TaxID=529605 RepID=A0AAV1E846_OLDCO|nr:OLC1v1016827C1 [Oldenlandia corymbosa var. corymbosa]
MDHREKESDLMQFFTSVSDFISNLFLGMFSVAGALLMYQGYVNGKVMDFVSGLTCSTLVAVVYIAKYGWNRGRRIGKLLLTTKEIGKGGNGSVVYEGIYGYRQVAVKCVDKAQNPSAHSVIKYLTAADTHRNIVRLVGDEEDEKFLYICLERCICNISDLVRMFSGYNLGVPDKTYNARMGKAKQSIQNKNGNDATKLWKDNGDPSPTLLVLMKEVAAGLVHLHQKTYKKQRKMVHGNLKPENLLISDELPLCVKLSDIGTSCSTRGWQPKEVLCGGGSPTPASDLFSLGCVYYFCITAGEHPFGDDDSKRCQNIKNGNPPDLSFLDKQPEAKELISRLLSHESQDRPTAQEVLLHPLFWGEATRLSFLHETSKKLTSKGPNDPLVVDIDNTSSLVLSKEWIRELHPVLRNNKYWRTGYDFERVKDLVRLIRDKYEHFPEYPDDIKHILGATPQPQGSQGELEANPEAYYHYFASRFPNLFIEVYKVMKRHCENEMTFATYFKNVKSN